MKLLSPSLWGFRQLSFALQHSQIPIFHRPIPEQSESLNVKNRYKSIIFEFIVFCVSIYIFLGSKFDDKL